MAATMRLRDDVLPLRLATVVYPPGHPLAGQTGVVNAYALRHPAGVVLVDTGVGEGNAWIDEHYQPVRQSLVDALGAYGLAIGDVIALINTHLHFDHCGGNHLFPGIPIYVQSIEYEAAHELAFTVVEWVDFEGASYHRIDGEAAIQTGIRLLPTPGHTPGHQSVTVQTDAGLVLLAGQAVQSRAEFEHLHRTNELPDGNAPANPAAYLASARRLISRNAARVYFSHDDAPWQRFRDQR